MPESANPNNKKESDPKKEKEQLTFEGVSERPYAFLGENNADENKDHALQVIRKLFVVLISLFLFIGLGVLILFFAFREQVEQEEIIASQSVADISIALVHAHMHHNLPPNHNWYDASFLKEHLEASLPQQDTLLCHLDSQGHFESCPYMLRIYTNSNQSRFLLIAQPSPSLLQWLIPKAAIVIDSEAMELRHATDLKALNRLLINSNTLDDINGTELSKLVKQGTIVTLSSLSNLHAGAEFLPPRELSFVRPGLETLIYNAPRYYKLDELLIQQAIKTAQGGEEKEHEILKTELAKILTIMPNKVFYVTQGLEAALEAEKVLIAYEKYQHFFLAYLTLNPLDGRILNSHLLLVNQAKDKEIAD